MALGNFLQWLITFTVNIVHHIFNLSLFWSSIFIGKDRRFFTVFYKELLSTNLPEANVLLSSKSNDTSITSWSLLSTTDISLNRMGLSMTKQHLPDDCQRYTYFYVRCRAWAVVCVRRRMHLPPCPVLSSLKEVEVKSFPWLCVWKCCDYVGQSAVSAFFRLIFHIFSQKLTWRWRCLEDISLSS